MNMRRMRTFILYVLLIGIVTPDFAHVKINSNIDVLIGLSEKSLEYYIQTPAFNLEPLRDMYYGQNNASLNRYEYMKKIEDYFYQKCPVAVDGRQLRPVVKKLDYCDTTLWHLGKPLTPLVLAGINLSYLLQQKPHTVEFNWDVFLQKPADGWDMPIGLNQDPQEVLVNLIAFGRPSMIVFTPDDSRYIWRDTSSLVTLREKMKKAVDPWKRHTLAVPVFTVVFCIVFLIVLICALRRKISWKVMAALLTALLVMSVVLQKTMVIEFPFPWEATAPLPEPKDPRTLAASLLDAVYHAFDSGDENAVFKALSESVEWNVLPKVYTQVFDHLTVKEGGNHRGTIENVEILDFQLLRFFKEGRRSKADLTAAWRTTAIVYHKSHFHKRVNEYSGGLQLTNRNGKWVIGSLTIKDWGMTFSQSGNIGEKDPASTPTNWPENYTTTIAYHGEKYSIDRFQPGCNTVLGKKIEGLIVNEPAPRIYKNVLDLFNFQSTMEFPGYGGSTGGPGDITSRGQFTFISVEIPLQEKYRTLVYLRKKENAPYELFDDFYFKGSYPPILSFAIDGNRVIYFHSKYGTEIGTKELLSP